MKKNFTPRYSCNTANVVVKYQSLQSVIAILHCPSNTMYMSWNPYYFAVIYQHAIKLPSNGADVCYLKFTMTN